MAYTLTQTFPRGFELRKPAYRTFADDPLGAMRGIAFAVLTNVLIFWLPVAIYLSR